jgi:hypothetical protein
MGSVLERRSRFVSHVLAAAFICGGAGTAQAQQSQPSTTPEKPQSPETAPSRPATPPASPVPAFVTLGPSRELRLGENTWFRFGAQIQAWARIAQDRIVQPGGGDGGYAWDYYCRRCRLFTTGSVVKDVYFNVLFEASNLGRADPITGAKSFAAPSILDAYGQVKFADFFWLSGGNILVPLTRNTLQPTTTYLSIDTANVGQTGALQANTTVLRDLGFQANGFFLDNHLEYRAGVFQGTRAGAKVVGTISAAGTCTPPTCTLVQTAGHNPPRFASMLSFNFWDTETGYVNGGHYYGAKRVLGVMANFDYQVLRDADPPAAGIAKNAYKGFSAAAFMNLPLNGPNPRGGDELAGLVQWGLYDGGLRGAPTAPTNVGTYPNVLKQWNVLAEAAYYSHALKFSVFGKYEMRKISDIYVAALQASSNQQWFAFGLKYYPAPFNLMNFGLQYERINFPDSDKAATPQQSGTHNVTFQMQTFLY